MLTEKVKNYIRENVVEAVVSNYEKYKARHTHSEPKINLVFLPTFSALFVEFMHECSNHMGSMYYDLVTLSKSSKDWKIYMDGVLIGSGNFEYDDF
ncbi:MAG TPA: hypothetical protein VIR29_07280 [Anseongella sp.]